MRPSHAAPRFAVTVLLASFALSACVPAQPGAGAADPSPTSSTAAPANGVATTDGPAPTGPMAKVEPEAPHPSVPTTIEIHSMCAQTVPVFYGEKPKYGSGTKSSVSPSMPET